MLHISITLWFLIESRFQNVGIWVMVQFFRGLWCIYEVFGAGSAVMLVGKVVGLVVLVMDILQYRESSFRLERTPAPFLVCYICLYMRINKLKVQPICCDENLL